MEDYYILCSTSNNLLLFGYKSSFFKYFELSVCYTSSTILSILRLSRTDNRHRTVELYVRVLKWKS